MTTKDDVNFYRFDGARDAHKLAGLVTGFGGRASDLEQAALDFTAYGYDSIIYEVNDPEIFLSGDPQVLLETTARVADDFHKQAIGYDAVRLVGVSLGGAIAANVQKQFPDAERGFFGATGANAPDIMMSGWFNNLVYARYHKNIRRAFERNGFDRDTLNDTWSEFQKAPDTPFTLALGGLDRIVRRDHAQKNIDAWRQYNSDIKVIESPTSNHGATIRRFNHTIVDIALNPRSNRLIRRLSPLADMAASAKSRFRSIKRPASNTALAV